MKPEEQLQKAIALCQQGENYSKKNSYSIALQYFDKAEPICCKIFKVRNGLLFYAPKIFLLPSFRKNG